MTLLTAPGDWLSLAPLLPFGALISDAGDPDLMGVAVLLPADYAAGQELARGGGDAPAVTVRGFGPGGAALAAGLANQAELWHQLGRPGVGDLRLEVRQRPAPETVAVATAATGGMLLRRPHALINAGWPEPG